MSSALAIDGISSLLKQQQPFCVISFFKIVIRSFYLLLACMTTTFNGNRTKLQCIAFGFSVSIE